MMIKNDKTSNIHNKINKLLLKALLFIILFSTHICIQVNYLNMLSI
jgi:hypothetical protein